MIKNKKAYFNNEFVVYEIYSSDNKRLFEISKNKLWNNSENNPLTIPKSRINDFIETNIDCEPIEEHNDNIDGAEIINSALAERVLEKVEG